MNKPLEQKDNDKVMLGTVGELRMYGLTLPSITEDTSDKLTVAFPFQEALNIATSTLRSWGLTTEQQAIVLNDNDHQRITDILRIRMYLQVLLDENERLLWVQGKNKAFSDMKVTDYIIEHGAEKVVGYLALHADGGGW